MASRKKPPQVPLSDEQRLLASTWLAQVARLLAGHLLNGKLRGVTMTWSPAKGGYLSLNSEVGESLRGVVGDDAGFTLLKPDNRYDVEVDDVVRYNNKHWIVDTIDRDDRQATLRHVRTGERPPDAVSWDHLEIVETPPSVNLAHRMRSG